MAHLLASAALVRVLTAVAIAAAVAAGCTSTVAGVPVRDLDASPVDVPPITAARLDQVLLNVGQLNGIAGATKLTLVVNGHQMSDNSAAVSDPDCLGSIFGAEEQVYVDSGWAAVRDQVAREPGDNEHWVEQTVVLYANENLAGDFVAASESAWRDCGGFSVAVKDANTSSIWLIDDVATQGDVMTQVVAQEDSDGWECQHALTAVANVSVETVACAFGINDEAVSMATALVANVARR